MPSESRARAEGRPAALRTVLAGIARALVDATAVLLGFFIAFQIREMTIPAAFADTSVEPLAKYAEGGIFFALVTVLVFWQLGLYQRRGSVLNLWELHTALKGMLVASALFLAAIFLHGHSEYSRLVVSGSIVLSTLLVVVTRRIVAAAVQRNQLAGHAGTRVLIYGCGGTGRMLMKKIVESPQLGAMVVGFLDDAVPIGRLIACRVSQTTAQPFAAPVLGRGSYWERIVRESAADELLISCAISAERRLEILEYSRTHDLRVGIVPHLDDQRVDDVYVEDLSAIPILRPGFSAHRSRRLYFATKRAFDIAVAAALMVLTAPIWILAAIVIPLESPGPVFFSQERVGKSGRRFRLLKFRSMWCDTNPYAFSPEGDSDPRITRSGRILRTLGFDELPQLVNVLKGEMSMVGPRPEMPFIVDAYTPHQRLRLEAKPGITGLWQISPDRHAAIHENLEYDLYYIRHQSVALDALILLETVFFTTGLALKAFERLDKGSVGQKAAIDAPRTASFLLVALDQRRRGGAMPENWTRLVPAVCRAAQLLPVRVLVAPDNVAEFDSLLHDTMREGNAEYELYTGQAALYTLVRNATLVVTDLNHVVRWSKRVGVGVFALDEKGVHWAAGAGEIPEAMAILTAMLAPALSIEPEVAGKHAAASASSYTIPISPAAIAS
jgi:exopolysaccharide biosynthesis polyprenyl glycosylphosphotransferase